MPIPLPVIAHTYRCTFNWLESVSGQHAANILHFYRLAGTSLNVFNDISASLSNFQFELLVNTARIVSVDIIPLDGTSGSVTFPTVGTQWNGSGPSGDFAPQLACIVKEVTGVRGRANRGRIYLPFVAEANQTRGALNTLGVSDMNTYWANFLAAMTTAVTLPVVASYDRRHSGATAHTTVIVQYLVESEAATQRKRMSRLR